MINTFHQRLKKRNKKERQFKFCCMMAMSVFLIFMATIIVTLIDKGYPTFFKTEIEVEVSLKKGMNYKIILEKSLHSQIGLRGVKLRDLKKYRNDILRIISNGYEVKIHKKLENNTISLDDRRKIWFKSSEKTKKHIYTQINKKNSSDDQNKQSYYICNIIKGEKYKNNINGDIIFNLDSQDAEQAGIWGAVVGSIYTMIITIIISIPVGVGTAVYLEEFLPKNKLSSFIEININNLAAVPSIIFGLVGAIIFLNILNLPRSSSLVGGLTLGLIMIPTIIISTRSSLKMVPVNIKNAAYGLGASKIETLVHHTIPLAMPGILTGSILGLARSIGECAPLLLIGMVAFITNSPSTPLDPATTLPVQIFSWAKNPDKTFIGNTAAATIVLLLILTLINFVNILIRARVRGV
jgi:phosphate transport system permease protein